MKYIIGFLAVAFVIWRIYLIFTTKSDIDLSNPNVGKGKIRPDKPGPLDDL